MTVWDYLLLAVTAALVLEGLFKGAVRLAFGLAGLFLGYLYAGYVASRIGNLLTFLPQNARGPAAIVAGFLLILTAAVFAGIMINKLVKAAGLGCLNRVLGAVLGFLFALYLAGGLVRMSASLSPSLHESMARGPVVRLMSGWAFGLKALLPEVEKRPPVPPPQVPARPGRTAAKGDVA